MPTPTPGAGKVGVTVLSGFLGSGKTTLLRRIVRDPVLGPRIAVIVNDLGELGLDHELIASEGATPTMRVQELTSGCICCTLRSDLGEALMQLGSGQGLLRRPEHILIEPSGIARASEVSFAVNALGFDAPVYTDAVITLVDAHSARRARAEQPELFDDQLRSADLVLLNKRDLVADRAEAEALEAWVRPLAPRATFLWTEQSQIDPALLLGSGGLEHRPETKTEPDHAPEPDHEHEPDEPHAHAPGRSAAPEAHGFAAISIPVPACLDQGALEDFLDAESERVFRIKGILDVLLLPDAAPGAPRRVRPLLVQAVGDRVDLDTIAADSPLYRAPRRLIFIGAAAALDRDRLERALREAEASATTDADTDAG